jgi:hypothetical protein
MGGCSPLEIPLKLVEGVRQALDGVGQSPTELLVFGWHARLGLAHLERE